MGYTPGERGRRSRKELMGLPELLREESRHTLTRGRTLQQGKLPEDPQLQTVRPAAADPHSSWG